MKSTNILLLYCAIIAIVWTSNFDQNLNINRNPFIWRGLGNRKKNRYFNCNTIRNYNAIVEWYTLSKLSRHNWISTTRLIWNSGDYNIIYIMYMLDNAKQNGIWKLAVQITWMTNPPRPINHASDNFLFLCTSIHAHFKW